MSNFTPGPWKAQADDFGYWGVYDNEGNCVAEAVEPGNDYLEAIQLMVTAPEMEDLLWAAWQELSFTSQHPYQTTEQDAKWEAELAKKIYALLRRMMSNHTPGPWEARIEGEEG